MITLPNNLKLTLAPTPNLAIVLVIALGLILNQTLTPVIALYKNNTLTQNLPKHSTHTSLNPRPKHNHNSKTTTKPTPKVTLTLILNQALIRILNLIQVLIIALTLRQSLLWSITQNLSYP
jgi:hypothetical protein